MTKDTSALLGGAEEADWDRVHSPAPDDHPSESCESPETPDIPHTLEAFLLERRSFKSERGAFREARADAEKPKSEAPKRAAGGEEKHLTGGFVPLSESLYPPCAACWEKLGGDIQGVKKCEEAPVVTGLSQLPVGWKETADIIDQMARMAYRLRCQQSSGGPVRLFSLTNCTQEVSESGELTQKQEMEDLGRSLEEESKNLEKNIEMLDRKLAALHVRRNANLNNPESTGDVDGCLRVEQEELEMMKMAYLEKKISIEKMMAVLEKEKAGGVFTKPAAKVPSCKGEDTTGGQLECSEEQRQAFQRGRKEMQQLKEAFQTERHNCCEQRLALNKDREALNAEKKQLESLKKAMQEEKAEVEEEMKSLHSELRLLRERRAACAEELGKEPQRKREAEGAKRPGSEDRLLVDKVMGTLTRKKDTLKKQSTCKQHSGEFFSLFKKKNMCDLCEERKEEEQRLRELMAEKESLANENENYRRELALLREKWNELLEERSSRALDAEQQGKEAAEGKETEEDTAAPSEERQALDVEKHGTDELLMPLLQRNPIKLPAGWKDTADMMEGMARRSKKNQQELEVMRKSYQEEKATIQRMKSALDKEKEILNLERLNLYSERNVLLEERRALDSERQLLNGLRTSASQSGKSDLELRTLPVMWRQNGDAIDRIAQAGMWSKGRKEDLETMRMACMEEKATIQQIKVALEKEKRTLQLEKEKFYTEKNALMEEIKVFPQRVIDKDPLEGELKGLPTAWKDVADTIDRMAAEYESKSKSRTWTHERKGIEEQSSHWMRPQNV